MRHAELAQRAVHQRAAGRDLMRLRKPAAQFGQGGIWPCRDLRLDRRIQPGQLRPDMATLGAVGDVGEKGWWRSLRLVATSQPGV